MARTAPALALAVALMMSAISPATASTEPTPGAVTLLFGRMQWVTTRQCQPLPNTVDLGRVKHDLDARGLQATGIVIPVRTPETGLRCFDNYTMHPGWDTIRSWHAGGWSFVSGGTHANMTTLTYEQQVRESCGSLDDFAAHGIDASGLFAYGNDVSTSAIQDDPVSSCYAFGRKYGPGLNQRSTIGAPWFASVHSVNGGKCNEPSLPCYERQYKSTYRYHSPVAMASGVAAAPDTWYAVQFYRFVDGSYANGTYAWDCTSADWRHHFTSHTELYCYRDFLTVIDALQVAVTDGAVATDPGSVASAWGRQIDTGPPPPADTTAPVVTIGAPAHGSTVAKKSTVTITAQATDDVGVTNLVTSVNGSVLCSVSTASSSCRWKVPAKPNATYTIEIAARDAAGNVGTAWATVRAL